MRVFQLDPDPGADIVVKAIEEDFAVVPIPGANAALTALIASGISPQPFYFLAFYIDKINIVASN
ncbi:Ribosomal RNA small subunit methyltransferase I [Ureibacillus acetophenoni]